MPRFIKNNFLKKTMIQNTRTLNRKPINHETLWKARLKFPKHVDHNS